jgi:hypothetical protein
VWKKGNAVRRKKDKPNVQFISHRFLRERMWVMGSGICLFKFSNNLDSTIEQFFPTVSRFLCKLNNKEGLSKSNSISDDDISVMTYKIFKPEEHLETWGDVRKIAFSSDQPFKRVRDIQEFNNTIRSYRRAILIDITFHQGMDIVDFIPLYLLMPYYENEKIITIIRGDTGTYYRLSHFFAKFNERPNMRDAVFFDDISDGKPPKRLVAPDKVPSRLTQFLPLFEVDQRQRDFLFNETLITNETADGIPGEYRLMWNGAMSILNKAEPNLIGLFQKSDRLTFLLFCYSLNGFGESEKNKFCNSHTARIHYLNRIKSYSRGCRQLAENIIFHSEKKCGILAIRVHRKENIADLFRARQIAHPFIPDTAYMEIAIADYSGLEKNRNIAGHFIAGLPAPEKEWFAGLESADFFKERFQESGDARTQELQKAWRKYCVQGDGENIVKHYGLKTFADIISSSKGVFWVKTHSTHDVKPGDIYISAGGPPEASKTALPGTQYSMLLPLSILHGSIMADFDMKSGIDVGNPESFDKYIDWGSKDIDIELPLAANANPEEKGARISALSNAILGEAPGEEMRDCQQRSVLQIDAGAFREENAETVFKALVLALVKIENIPVAFCNCNRDFMDAFAACMKVFFSNLGSTMFRTNYALIALFEPGSITPMIFAPASCSTTCQINKQVCQRHGIHQVYLADWKDQECIDDKAPIEYIPFEILCTWGKGGCESKTLFEEYTEKIIETNIQDASFGCRIQPTHMRLGSTIHLDRFYQAEILFNNMLFASRFAFLIVRCLRKEKRIEECGGLTLYGYSAYSELLLNEIATLIRSIYQRPCGKNDFVNYMILERDSERRDAERDTIRFSWDEEKDKYPSRGIILVVPINSTLKTVSRMVDLLINGEKAKKIIEEPKILECFSVCSVLDLGQEDFYTTDREKRIQCSRSALLEANNAAEIHYFVAAEANYHDPNQCPLCYPENPLLEVPLIEVNATSTIPDQSFDILDGEGTAGPFIGITPAEIEEEDCKYAGFRSDLLYSHIERRGNHFQFYIQSEKYIDEEREQIRAWLREQEGNRRSGLHGSDLTDNPSDDVFDYNILWAPLHYSNAGFVEMVNELIFYRTAHIIRVDVDKEFRTNIKAKFSYLTTLLNDLKEDPHRKYRIRIHYIDDTIIGGSTFERSKSLLSSIFPNGQNTNVSVALFDTIWLLYHRLSAGTERKYQSKWIDATGSEIETEVFSYRKIRISSLRTHGDSCIVCNLQKDANRLMKSSSVGFMRKQWASRWEKLGTRSVADAKAYQEDRAREMEKIGYRYPLSYERFFATHLLGKVISEIPKCRSEEAEDRDIAEDRKTMIAISILTVLQSDWDYRASGKCGQYGTDGKIEYFFSYLKAASRPFAVFDKQVREVVFDILLIFIESVLSGQPCETIIQKNFYDGSGVPERLKKYLCDEKAKRAFANASKILEIVSGAKCADMLKLLMKQLTDLNSNYLLRTHNMNRLFCKMSTLFDGDHDSMKKFSEYYAQLIKKLTGASSDTAKSFWLEQLLRKKAEPIGKGEKLDETLMQSGYFQEFLEIVDLENNKLYYDAITTLARKVREKHSKGDIGKIQKSLAADITWRKLVDELLEIQRNPGAIRTFPYRSIMSDAIDAVETGLLPIEAAIEGNYCNLEGAESAMSGRKNTIDALEKEIRGSLGDEFLFNNFRKVFMEESKQGDGSKGIRELEPIIYTVALFWKISDDKLKFENEKNNAGNADNHDQEIYRRFLEYAIILQNILDAFCVYFCTNTEMIHTRTRKTTEDWLISKNSEKKPCNETKYLKHYFNVLAGTLFINPEEPEEQAPLSGAGQERLNKFADMADKSKNYYIHDGGDEDGGKYLIIKLPTLGMANSEDTIYIYSEIKKPDLHRIKCIMTFFDSLEKYVFRLNSTNYLHQLIIEKGEKSIAQRGKYWSHTDSNRQKDLFALAKSNEQYLAGSMAVLLSDLCVSETFRTTSDKETKTVVTGLETMDLAPEIKDLRKLTYDNKQIICIKTEEAEIAASLGRLGVEGIPFCKERYIDINGTTTTDLIKTRDVFSPNTLPLLIVSVIMNALKNIPPPDSLGQQTSMDVYLTITEQNQLRIWNHAVDLNSRQIKKSNESLLLPPSAVGGISLWTISRYVDIVKSTLLSNMRKTDMDEGKLYDAVSGMYTCLYSEPYCVRMGVAEPVPVVYTILPVLAGQYNKYSEYYEGKGGN